MTSYDGRNQEPTELPVRFPLLLAQGTEGIAAGLSSKILPHNFNELIDASIAILKGQPFEILPDFPTGGIADCSKYNKGKRGGMVKVRARINKVDKSTITITEIPYGKTSHAVIDSILKAKDKKKINIKKIEDMTTDKVEIVIHLPADVSPDKTIDALYAFTDCEINIAPNCCVIVDKKPMFLTVSDLLRYSTDHTKDLLRQELEIRKGELLEQLHFASLEKIFIEERIYKGRPFENAPDMDAACAYVDERLTPFYPQFIREVTKEDILRLMEIKMQRILKFNKDKADDLILRIKAEIDQINHDLEHLVDYTIKWYQFILDKYGDQHPRLTEIKSFDTIVASKVVEANQKLYINRNDGFIGTGLKKDEFVCNCSDIDDIIVFYRDGKYKVVKVAEKIFVGKNILHVQVFKKNDTRTIYNVVYRDGKRGSYYMKRFNVTSLAREKEYDLTQGTPGSRVVYFTCNPNGEAELIKVTLDPNPKIKKIFLERDFSDILIKGRGSKGNLLTKYPIHRIALKSHGHSTLGGRKVWWDPDVNRLNYDEHGQLLGEFNESDSILVVLDNGEFYLSNFDTNNHYESNVRIVEKWKPEKVWSCVLFDADQQGFPYLKRFKMEGTKRHQNYLGDNPDSRELLLTCQPYPRIQVNFGGSDAGREPMVIDAESFIAVKGFKARGKRITTLHIDSVEELEPTKTDLPEEEAQEQNEAEEPENLDPDKDKSEQDIITELTGQQFLQFDDDDM